LENDDAHQIKKGEYPMSKTNRKDFELSEDEMLDLYDQLASQWARKMEAQKGQA
jgi:hypothetical protein